MAEIKQYLTNPNDPIWKLNTDGIRYLDELRERLTIYLSEPIQTALERLKLARLENSQIEYFPFKNSDFYNFSIPAYDFDRIMPTTFYLLQYKLAFHLAFRKMMRKFKFVDFDTMDRIYVLKIDHKDPNKIKYKGLAPIFLKFGYFPNNYSSIIPALLDGTHRFVTGTLEKRPTSAIVINDLNKTPLNPHHKIPHSWNFTYVQETVPDHDQKADYVDFNPEFSYHNLLPLTSVFAPAMLALPGFMWGDVGRLPGTFGNI